MDIKERPLFSSSVRERDVDLTIIQLVETSHEFREWLIEETTGHQSASRFLGASHSVGTSYGETDIEVGFETENGEHHLILIEDKVTASFQDEQISRYFDRAEMHVSNGYCDEFSVTLVAPQAYVGESERGAFDSILTYEEILARLDEISHDGVSFFQEVLDNAIKKRETHYVSDYPEYSAWNEQIMERALSEVRNLVTTESSDVPEYEIDSRSPWLKSGHEGHPESVVYRFKIQLEQDTSTITPGDVEIRIDIESESDSSSALRALEGNAALFEADGFSISGNQTYGVVSDHWQGIDHSDLEDERFLDEVAERFAELVETGHEALTEANR